MPKTPSFTRGPWKEYKGAVHPVLEYPRNANANGGYIICDDFCGPDAPFNRRLVAGAPALVSALREMVEVMELAMDSGLFLSVDGKRPDVMALDRAKEVLCLVGGEG